MSGGYYILTDVQMKESYGSFYSRSARLQLDRSKVPERYWPLLPYAEFWGLADDWTRQALIDEAPPEVKSNLKNVVGQMDSDLDAWLAGPEANGPNFSDEYIAFTALRMAADYA